MGAEFRTLRKAQGWTQERLATRPVYDVVTTTVYSYERAGVRVTDRTMALKLMAKGDRRYPLPEELAGFGEVHCGVKKPRQRMELIADAMQDTLSAARSDDRIPRRTLSSIRAEWGESSSIR